MTDVGATVDRYLFARAPGSRLSSFDFCFNHFQAAYERGDVEDLADGNLETSCLQLCQYLASWGMYRGSGQLINKSMQAYVPVIEWVASDDHQLWRLDLDAYDADTLARLLAGQTALSDALGFSVSGTLATKVMLGIFGCVPAFDRFFRIGFGASGFRRKHLRQLRSFYDEHAESIDRERVATIAFSGSETTRNYTAAKVVDMVFFVEGGGM